MLYLGTETGLFVTLDRGTSWKRLKANLPTVRIDEITLHPRDNAMLLATHGRGIWILDHLEPIQEYAAAQAADAKLFSPPPTAMYRRPARDRNYEFWGDQTFFGENPPQAAVIAWHLKKDVGDVKLKITDAVTGKEVREISGQALANSNKAGFQAACWDLRVQPLPPPAGGTAGRAAAAGRCGAAVAAAAPTATAGSRLRRLADAAAARQAVSPFGAGCGGGGGVRRRRRFGGGRRQRRPVRPARRLHRLARRRRQDRRDQAAEGDGRSRGRPDGDRAQEDVRHGDGDARTAALATEVSSALTPLNTRMTEIGEGARQPRLTSRRT